MTSITLSESSKRVVENITKIVCELMTLKVELIADGNQGTEKQQKQLYVLNQLLKTYSQKKKDVLHKSFEYTPFVTTYTEQNALFDDTKSNEADTDNLSNDVTQNSKENEDENENATESEYEFSDVDEDETIAVNKIMAKATTKLKRNRQTKQYIHITTTY